MGTGRNTENFLVHEFTNGRLSLGVSEGAHWKWLRLVYTVQPSGCRNMLCLKLVIR
jgi:hypothetical protein